MWLSLYYLLQLKRGGVAKAFLVSTGNFGILWTETKTEHLCALERLEQERSRDQDVLDVLRKFDADLLRRVLDLGSQAVLAQDKQLWSTAKGVDKTVAKEKQDRLENNPVKPLLLAGANPNGYKDKNGETALHVAAAGGKQNVVASLLAS